MKPNESKSVNEGFGLGFLSRGLGDLMKSKDYASREHNGPSVPATAEQRAAVKEQRDIDSQNYNKAVEQFPKATQDILTVTKKHPGQVDAWVDSRLKPAVKRAVKDTSGIEDMEYKYKKEKEAWTEKYAKEDREAKEYEKEQLRDSEEIVAKKKAEEEKARLEKQAKEAGERAAANRTFGKRDALMPLNSTPEQERDIMRERKHDDALENKYAKLANAAATDDFWSKYESVSTGKLRAAFESVYGSSEGYSDDEIRTICESCYRRSLNEGVGDIVKQVIPADTLKKLASAGVTVAMLASLGMGIAKGVEKANASPAQKQSIEFQNQQMPNLGEKAKAFAPDVLVKTERALGKIMKANENNEIGSKAAEHYRALANANDEYQKTGSQDSANKILQLAQSATAFVNQYASQANAQ